MYLYGLFDNEDVSKKVSISSIKYLSSQLDAFLKIYENNVMIENDEDRQTIERLKRISELLKDGRYDQLIADPTFTIDFNDNNDDYLPDYFPI